MDTPYHIDVVQRALRPRLSERAIEAIIRANLGQDAFTLANLQHPEWHYDNNLFAEGGAYVETNRQMAARATTAAEAWAAFGRLTHAVQDFYSHSNYVALWLEKCTGDAIAGPAPFGEIPPVVQAKWPQLKMINPLDVDIIKSPRLRSGQFYVPYEILWLFEILHPFLLRTLPRDSHAWMNLDTPKTGPLFPYSIEAALKRTVFELDRTLAAIGEEQGEEAIKRFCDQ